MELGLWIALYFLIGFIVSIAISVVFDDTVNDDFAPIVFLWPAALVALGIVFVPRGVIYVIGLCYKKYKQPALLWLDEWLHSWWFSSNKV